MSSICEVLRELARSESGGYIPYVCTADPDREFSLDLMHRLSEAGADIFEMGIPFSDPIADGPVIQEAMQRSLSHGFRTSDIFEMISAARDEGIRQPIVVMTYYNSIMQAGVREFCSRLADSGGNGILAVDLLPEDSTELDLAAKNHNLDLIRLIAPSTPDSRMDIILSKASGFVYAVSVAGTTGARDDIPRPALDLIRRMKARSDIPIALGFGISNPDHVRSAMAAGASAVVEGSKLISIYSLRSGDREEALEEIRRHAADMKAAARFRSSAQSAAAPRRGRC